MAVGELFEAPDALDESDYETSFVRCVLFRLETELYGVNVQRVREVLRVGEIRPVPGSPHNVLGVINVRGVIVTVLDSRQYFKLSSAAVTDLSRIIIVEQDEHVLGLLVDEVKEVRDIPEHRIDALGAMSDDATNRLIQGVAHVQDEGVVIIIDPEKFFDSATPAHAGAGFAADDDLF